MAAKAQFPMIPFPHKGSVDRSEISFHVVDRFSRDWSIVTRSFTDQIAPLYGDQTAALRKIAEGADRLCEVLFHKESAVGVLVYKKALVERGYLELKTLMVIDAKSNSGKGYGTLLFSRIHDVAVKRFATGIQVSVSDRKPESLAFFEKKGFRKYHSTKDLYCKGSTEHFLYLPTPQDSSLSPADGKRRRMDKGAEKTATAAVVSYAPQTRVERIPLKTIYIRQIQSGSKTMEGRVNTGPFQRLREGMIVEWFSHDRSVRTRIVKRSEFPTFEAMVSGANAKKLLPFSVNEHAAAAEYHKIPRYSEKVARFGAVAFDLQLLRGDEAGVKRGRG